MNKNKLIKSFYINLNLHFYNTRAVPKFHCTGSELEVSITSYNLRRKIKNLWN